MVSKITINQWIPSFSISLLVSIAVSGLLLNRAQVLVANLYGDSGFGESIRYQGLLLPIAWIVAVILWRGLYLWLHDVLSTYFVALFIGCMGMIMPEALDVSALKESMGNMGYLYVAAILAFHLFCILYVNFQAPLKLLVLSDVVAIVISNAILITGVYADFLRILMWIYIIIFSAVNNYIYVQSSKNIDNATAILLPRYWQIINTSIVTIATICECLMLVALWIMVHI